MNVRALNPVVVTENQDRTSHPTGVAVRPRHLVLVELGGRDRESGFYLFNARPRPISAHVGVNDRPLPTHRPAIGGCRPLNYRDALVQTSLFRSRLIFVSVINSVKLSA